MEPHFYFLYSIHDVNSDYFYVALSKCSRYHFIYGTYYNMQYNH